MKVFDSLSTMGHEQVVFCNDKASGLKAIIAIHDTTLGPALGGCRMWDYNSEEEALRDVLRLSRGMTYKAAITGLNLGGGKAVIIGDPKKLKSEVLFKTFGRFIDSLGGRYITAEDVNIRVRDMEIVATETPYVTGISSHQGSGDPSPVTAMGVYYGIKASVKHKLGKDNLRGLKVAIQGCGAVGSNLAQLLHNDGVKLYVSDLAEEKAKQVADRLGAELVDLNKIHALSVDVFAPCALGGVINDETIADLKATIIAGAANNQLLDEELHGKKLKERGILYAPDYVINAGGLINVYEELRGYDPAAAKERCSGIFDTLLRIYQEADSQNLPTVMASNRVAEERINSAKRMNNLRNTFDNQLWIASK
ncbi:MAG: Glu/Leu/Phe/Val dehydrogenase [Oligoflexales bacterium]